MDRSHLTAAVVAILGDQGIVGTGFVVSKAGLIVTCAHVITDAKAEPGEDVRVKFLADGTMQKAHVDPRCWREQDEGDLAVLKLSGPLPERVVPVELGSSAALSDRDLFGYGFPQGEDRGLWAGAHVMGELDGPAEGTKILQLRSQEISPGYSGGPLLDEARGRVVGIMRAIRVRDSQTGRHTETAFAIPMETFGTVIAGARVQMVGDLDLRELTEQISAALLPRCAWPRPLDVLDERVDDIADLARALEACPSLKRNRPHAILLRLPQEIADRVIVDLGSNSEGGRWGRALVAGCASWVDGLALLAAVVMELETSTSATARDFAELVQQRPGCAFSESAQLDAIARAADANAGGDDAKLRARVAACAPGVPFAGLERVEARHRLAWFVRFLADLRPGAEGTLPLQKFLDRLADTAPGPDSPAVAPPAHFVTVAVEPQGDGLYGAQIWRMSGNEHAPKLRVDGVSLEQLREEVSRARATLGASIASSDQTVEFALPRSMISEGVEHWKVIFGARHHPVGRKCRVVIRSWDRLFKPELRSTWGDWRQKWAQYRARPELHWIEPFERAQADTVFDALGQSDVSGVGLASAPEPTVADRQSDPIAMCDDAGIPVAIWLRDTGGSNAKTLLEPHLAAADYPRLPDWAREGRSGSIRAELGCYLTVLWDDPDRLPPDLLFARENVGKRSVG